MNAYRYISEILRPVVVPYFTGLLNAIFQQDNARPHLTHCVLNFLHTQVFDCCPNLLSLRICHSLKSILSWVTVRLVRHPSPTNTIHEVWHRLEKHGMSYLFLSSKPSSPKCLTDYVPFYPPGLAGFPTNFASL